MFHETKTFDIITAVAIVKLLNFICCFIIKQYYSLLYSGVVGQIGYLIAWDHTIQSKFTTMSEWLLQLA